MQLRVLFVEDSENDAALVGRELKRIGYELDSQRVETAEAMRKALQDKAWDVILCDYSLPSFSASAALEQLKASGKDLPFIIVSGTIDEETAVTALRMGAHDFILKGNLARLGPALQRELREAALRREHRQAQEALAASQAQLRAVLNNAPIMIFVLDAHGIFTLSQGKGLEHTGIKPGEQVGRSALDLYGALPFVSYTGETMTGREVFQRALDGEMVNAIDELNGVVFDNHLNPIFDGDGKVVGVVGMALDITERRQAEEALRKSERVLREAEALGHTGSWDQDLLTGEIFNTPENLRLFFGDQPGGKGGPFEDYPEVVHPDDREYVLRRRADLLEGGPGEIEYRVIWPDGSIHVIYGLATIVRDASGKAVRVYGTNLDITERKLAEQAALQHLSELEMLYESGLTLGQSHSAKEIAQRIIDLMGSKLHWHHTTIRLYHPEDQSLELLAFNLPSTMGEAEARTTEERFKTLITNVGDGLSGWAVMHRQVVRVGNLAQDLRYRQIVAGLNSGLYVPLQTGERVVGVISIESERPEAFSHADERLMTTLANQAAVALENARLHEETLRQLHQLRALHAIDQTIAGSFDPQFTLEVVLSHTLSQLQVDAAAVLLFKPFEHILQYFTGKGFRTRTIESVRLELGNTFAGQAVLKRETVRVLNPQALGSQPVLSQLWAEEGFKSMYAVPLISKGVVHGVLGVFHRAAFSPDPTWSDFLATIAGQAAIAIDSAQLFNGLQRANMELALAYDATIEGWSQAMDLRDKETEGHTRRVTEMSVRLGKSMDLDNEQLVQLRRGALLHDIGKLGVPDHILLKPDTLTEEELQIMRRHPQFAYEMLSPITYLGSALDIPHCHHEKWDGTGYPQGLKEEEIPLAARIFAVVDVWDALTSDRPYRKAWTKPAALGYIREQKGLHFDPRVVEAFLREFADERQ